MANGSSRIVPALLFLVVGVAIGWFAHSRAGGEKPVTTPKGPQVAIIGHKASENSVPLVHLSKTDGDVLFFLSRAKERQLLIETDTDAFENTSPGKHAKYRLSCQGRRCYSDEIKASVPEGTSIKYWQVLVDPAGNEDAQDGMIIIDK
jgi:hypothetical protein